MLRNSSPSLRCARFLFVAFTFALAGCGSRTTPTPAATPFNLAQYNAEYFAWPEAEKKGEVPGIDEGTCFSARKSDAIAFVIWADVRMGSGSWGGAAKGAFARGEKQGEQEFVRWEWKPEGGTTGTLMLNEEPYVLEKGTLFLVSTRGGQPRVKQLDKDLSVLKDKQFEQFVESLKALAKSDKEISEFFVGAGKGK